MPQFHRVVRGPLQTERADHFVALHGNPKSRRPARPRGNSELSEFGYLIPEASARLQRSQNAGHSRECPSMSERAARADSGRSRCPASSPASASVSSSVRSSIISRR